MKAITVIIVLVILFVATLFISEGSRRRDREYFDNIIKDTEKKEKILKLQLDSLQSSYTILEEKYKDVYNNYIRAAEDLNKANKKYEKVRNSKPVPYTDNQIDSILNRYYPKP